MRIGMLISGSLNNLTGGYIYDRKIIENIEGLGHQVEIIQLPAWNYPSRLANSLQLALSNRLDSLAVDILLQDELDHPALFLLNRRLKSKAGPPIISIVHHLRSSETRPPWQNHIFRQVEKSYLTRVDGFIFNSLTTRRTVENLIGQEQPSIVAYPCGNIICSKITPQQIVERAEKPGPLRVLFVGNVIRRKGLHVLLRALSKLPDNTCSLTIVGDLSMDLHYVRSIRNQIKSCFPDGQTRFLGSISDSELSEVFSQHHVLAVPSSYEGFGMVYLEAMSFGLPAIGSTSGAASEIITQGVNGFLVHPDDPVELAGYLLQLSRDQNLLTTLSLNALLRYENHPGWENTCNDIIKFLQEMKKV